VGLWDGSPAFYRDTITRTPPATCTSMQPARPHCGSSSSMA
jgi:hypothetical protein